MLLYEMLTGTQRCLQLSLALSLACCPPGTGSVHVSQPINPSVARTTGDGSGGPGRQGWAAGGCLLYLAPAHSRACTQLREELFPLFHGPLSSFTPPRTLAARGLGKYLKGQLGVEQSGGSKHFLPSLLPQASQGLSAQMPWCCASWGLKALHLERGSL